MKCSGRDIRGNGRLCPSYLAGLLEPFDGRPLNKVRMAKELGVSRHTIASWLKLLESAGQALLLPHLGGGGKPLLWLRSASFRGSRIQTVIARVAPILPEARFCWWRTGRVRRIDLVVETPTERVGFAFCALAEPFNREIWPLRIAHRRGVIQRGFLLHDGRRAFLGFAVLNGLPWTRFLEDLRFWIEYRPTREVEFAVRMRINFLPYRLAEPPADR